MILIFGIPALSLQIIYTKTHISTKHNNNVIKCWLPNHIYILGERSYRLDFVV